MPDWGYARVNEGSIDNLRSMLALADATDWAEGLVAFHRYHRTIRCIADAYGQSLDRVVAAFVAMSPNNDYTGNLRATVSLLEGIKNSVPCYNIKTATYHHCRSRAYAYLKGKTDFLGTVKGPKIRAFYQNILNPHDPEPVTIDGHLVCCWLGKSLPMKKALLRSGAYGTIAYGVRQVARENGLLANQAQAVLWFTRKRVHRSKYDPQLNLFQPKDDAWRTYVSVEDIRPYT